MKPADVLAWRKALGLTQVEFARMVGVANARTVRRWEDGERDIPGPVIVLWELAGAFPVIVKALKLRAAG